MFLLKKMQSIVVTDSCPEGQLKNYSYNHCDNNSSDEIKKSRGIVYKNGEPFVKAFGYTPEYSCDNIDAPTIHYLRENFSNLRFFSSYEGTLLRVYYNDINSKWYTSTHRKLNALNSRWGSSDTFGEKSGRYINDNLFQRLDKNKKYMFLLTLSEKNRMVCTSNLDCVFHVGTYDANFNLSYDEDVGIPKPPEHKFSSYEELLEYVNARDFDLFSIQGIIAANASVHKNVKILNPQYTQYYNLRGNVASINFRYLQIRMNEQNREVYAHMYPNNIRIFENYENIIYTVARQILNSYIKRFINKQHEVVSQDKYRIIKLCHERHLMNKEENKISINIVLSFINLQDALFLNRLIKSYKKETLVTKSNQGGETNDDVMTDV